MITTNELNIANTSYTNKDFQSIYSEILELAQKISNRWNPDQSNESDPGIVLLKLMAFIADKNNYNIDKNILEAFMPSATQMSSMRKLCEMNGYNMKYYNSSTTNVKFMYTGNELSESFTMTLPAFTTTITNEDKNVTYSLIQDCVLSKRNVAQSVTCIEGTFQDLLVNDSNILHLSSLDDNNRIYFNVQNVAENGVYIYNSNENSSNYYGDYWKKVDNLNNQELNSKVFKFGYDSIVELPYVEFPSDIASLISSGIRIRYVETTGDSGNVSANVLTTLSSTTSVDVLQEDESGQRTTKTITLSSDNLLINNANSSNNGCSPESIDDAYSNFKKTVGTFDTLVTCRDYMKAIYNMTDDSLNTLVSNCQVTDRRTDYNYSNNILVGSDTTTYMSSYTDNDVITPYDLCIYPLKPLTNSFTSSSYNNSFKPLGSATTNTIASLLDDTKCISHTFKELDNNDVYAFKNYYSLQATINTMYKVNTYEQNEILSNIYLSLYNNFYSRKLEYGQEIPFDSILETIETADTRIKSVSLLEPNLSTKVLKTTGDEVDFDLTNSIEYVIPYLAKNILSGKVALFSFDDRFVNSYGQSNSKVYENLISANTEVVMSRPNEYELKENEVVQLIAPSYVVDVEYSANTNYRYENTSSSTAKLEKDTIHKLQANETLKLNWTDSSGVVHDVTYKDGDIIKPNKDISVTTKGSITKNEKQYDQLGASDIIDHMQQSSYNIVSNSLPCYWILNNSKTLFDTNTKTRILQDNEYFFYSNSALTEMVTLGSGTRLTLVTSDDNFSSWTIPDDETILSADDILSNGISAFSGLNWKYKSGFEKLVVDEMQIVTLTEGMKVTLHDTNISEISNEFKTTTASISPILTYVQDATTTNLPQIQVSDSTWQIRSRLDLNAGTTKGQYIDNTNRGQVVKLTYKTTSEKEEEIELKDTNMKFNTTIQFSGGSNIDLSVTDLATGNVSNDVNCLIYDSEDIVTPTQRGISKTNEEIIIDFSNIDANTNVLIPLSIINKNATNIVPIYMSHVDISKNVTYTFKIYKGGSQVTSKLIRLYNTSEYVSTIDLNYDSQMSKLYNLEINCKNFEDNNVYYLCITSNESLKDTITINNSVTILGLNSKLGLTTSEEETKLLTKIKELDVDNAFYYMNPSTTIDVDNMLSPRAFFDINNVANNMTISQIDTSSLGKITIARTSKA